MAEALGDDFAVEICECQSQIGSGALPLETIASAGLAIAAKRKGPELERLSATLRELRSDDVHFMELEHASKPAFVEVGVAYRAGTEKVRTDFLKRVRTAASAVTGARSPMVLKT